MASFNVDDEYITSVAKELSKKGLKVKVADRVQKTADEGQFFES